MEAPKESEYRSEDEDSTHEDDSDQTLSDQDPVIWLQQNPSLRQDNWNDRNSEDHVEWRTYIPSWSRPGYDDNVEVSHDGTQERLRRGGIWSWMRPALLPSDPRPTQYAQRFGIFPDRKLNENSEARSMLTPGPTSATTDDFDTQWGFEKSFQSTVFQSFTTQELSDVGALDPNQTLPEPDLQGGLWHLFARNRWPQLGNDFWYNLDGQDKLWNVQKNDELWAALQPSLQFASRVLQSEHPYWKAVLSFYHLRPVPTEKDGRTDEEKSDPEYKPYISMWYDVDRSKMYSNARALMDKNFDSTAATLEVLRLLLRFSIVNTDGTAAGTTRQITAAATARPNAGPDDNARDYRIRIEINATYIWPLLAPQYSVSEKTAVSFFLGKTILHELIHAAKCAHLFLLGRPTFLTGMMTNVPWNPPPNTAFNWDIISSIVDFREEAFPVVSDYVEYMFQDVPQMEEGKCYEQQLFGFEVSCGPHPAPGKQNEAFRPLVSAISWPWKHPAIHLQNQRSVNAGLYRRYASHGYRMYLLDPPASAYDLMTPIRISSFAKFMQQSWWELDFWRFGHQALKIPLHSTDPSSPIKTIAVHSETVLAPEFMPMLRAVLRSKATLDFIDYAVPVLRAQNHTAILRYLMLLTMEASSAGLMRNRLHYEKRTWPRGRGRIEELSRTSAQDFNTVWVSLNQTLQSPTSPNILGNIRQVAGNIHTMLINLTELDRLLGVEIQYSQAIAAQYILKTPEERRKIHRRYMSLIRQNIIAMTQAIRKTVENIGRDHVEQGVLQWQTIRAPWEARLTFMITTNSGKLDGNALQQMKTATETLATLRKAAQQKCVDLVVTTGHVDRVVEILSDGYIDFPVASAARELFPSVPIARSMMTLSKSVEAAAVKEIKGLTNKGIDDIVRQWVQLLEAYFGLSDRMRGVRQDIRLARTMADISAIKTVLFQVKRDEVQPPPLGGPPAKDQALARIRTHMRNTVQNNGDLINFLRDLCGAERDDEEFQTIMRIPYEVPPQQ